MARKTRGGLDFDADGKAALDKVLMEQMINPRVTMILMSRPLPEGGKRPVEQEVSMPQPKRKKNNNPKGRGSQSSGQGAGGGAQQGSGGGAKKNFEGKKGKGKGNGKPFISMPKELLEFNPMARSGKRICFAYNLDGCSARGAECKKGVHVCIRCGSSEHGQRSSRCKGA